MLKERDPEIIIFRTTTAQGRNILSFYKAQPLLLSSIPSIVYIDFPIVIDKEVEEEKKKEKIVHPKIEGDALMDFITCLHGSYWPIWKIRDAFHKKHPEISARVIKKKVPAIAFKEKGEHDVKV